MTSKTTKNDMNRIGLFSEIGYVSTGEKYSNPAPEMMPERKHGKQFIVVPGKKGRECKDAYFEKKYLNRDAAMDDVYVDMIKLRRKWRLEAAKKNITPNAFRPSSVPQKPSGAGSIFGTITHAFPMKSKTDGKEKEEKQAKPQETPKTKKTEFAPRNFLIKPSKKGSGYGYVDVTISPYTEHLPDPFDYQQELLKQEREENKKKIHGDHPFSQFARPQPFFEKEIFKGVLGPFTIKDKKASKDEKLPAIPFKPSSPAKKGIWGTINKYPEHEGGESDREHDEGSDKARVESAPVFHPTSGPKSYPIRSIIDCNIPVAPPVWVKEARTKAMQI